MPFLSTVWKRAYQLIAGTISTPWEKARAVAGGLTGVFFTASSAFDLENIFLRIKGTGLIFPILTTVISGIVYIKASIQEEVHDGIKALQKNKLFGFLRDQLKADAKQASSTGSSPTTSTILINMLREKSTGKTSADFDSAITKLKPSDIEAEESADVSLTKEEENALLLALSNLYDENYSGWQKYSHAILIAAFSLVSGFSEGLQLSVFAGRNDCLFNFSNFFTYQTLLPAALTAIGLYHAFHSLKGVKASYEQPSLAELDVFLTQLIYNIKQAPEEKTPLLGMSNGSSVS